MPIKLHVATHVKQNLKSSIAQDIVRTLAISNGKPFSLKQLQKELLVNGKKYDSRTIGDAVNKLEVEGKVGTTHLAKAIAVYLPTNLPVGIELTSLDELVKSGQYPLYSIISKMKDVGFPEQELCAETGLAPIGKRTRDLMELASEEILWWAGDFSRYEELKPYIQKALEKNVKFRILMRVDFFSVNNAKMILDLQKNYPNLEVRQWESQWRGSIFDSKKARLIEKIPRYPESQLQVSKGKPGTDKEFKYDAYFIDGSSKANLRQWVNWLRMIWETHWKMAEKNPEVKTLVRTLTELKENLNQ